MFLLGATTVFAGNKSEKFLVNENAKCVKKAYRMAALSVAGVSKADWNKETKEISVTLDDTKTTAQKVHDAIAAVGHDTNLVKAKDEVYKKLTACCKYDRSDLKAPEKAVKHEHK